MADMLDLIRRYPFAFVTCCDEQGKPVVTQVSVLAEERDGRLYLSGHVMKQTDHYKALIRNPECLLVFTGPSTYVSASWYSNPHKGSTWNYMSVHARGKVAFLDAAGAVAFMQHFTAHFEGGDTASPTVYDNLPGSYTTAMMSAIAIFEMRVDAIDSVFKLSQDRDEASYDNIMVQLKEQGGNAALIAGEMERRRERLWSGSKSDHP